MTDNSSGRAPIGADEDQICRVILVCSPLEGLAAQQKRLCVHPHNPFLAAAVAAAAATLSQFGGEYLMEQSGPLRGRINHAARVVAVRLQKGRGRGGAELSTAERDERPAVPARKCDLGLHGLRQEELAVRERAAWSGGDEQHAWSGSGGADGGGMVDVRIEAVRHEI